MSLGSGLPGEPPTRSSSQVDAAMQLTITRWRSSVWLCSRSMQRAHVNRLLLSDFTGIAPQSTSRQHAPSAVRSASGQSVNAPPCAHSARVPSMVSSSAPHPPMPMTMMITMIATANLPCIAEIIAARGLRRRSASQISLLGRLLILLPDQPIDRHVRDAGRDQLGDVEHLDPDVDVALLHAVGEHDVTERAGDRHRGDLRGDDLVRPVQIYALALGLLHEHPSAARAAAEAVALAALELAVAVVAARLEHRAHDVAGRIELAVPPSEVAAVVVRDGADRRGLRLELAVLVEPVDQLRVVNDLEVGAELRVVVAQRVEAMRARRHDLLRVDRRQRLDVLLGEHLEQHLVTGAPRRIA